MCSDPNNCYECLDVSYYLDQNEPMNCKQCFPELLDENNICQIVLCDINKC